MECILDVETRMLQQNIAKASPSRPHSALPSHIYKENAGLNTIHLRTCQLESLPRD